MSGRGRGSGRSHSSVRLPNSLLQVLVQAVVFQIVRDHQKRVWRAHCGGGLYFSSERFVIYLFYFCHMHVRFTRKIQTIINR